MPTFNFNSKKIRFGIVFVLIFINVNRITGQTKSDMRFTPERQSLAEKMGDFFDRIVRENFPSEDDTLSYKEFFDCIILNPCPSDFCCIRKTDGKRLSEINAELFKDENYYFFYNGDWHLPENDPVGYRRNIRYEGEFCWCFPTNPDSGGPNNGYMRYIVNRYIDNPLFKMLDRDIRVAGGFSFSEFLSNILFLNLREISDPTVKQFTAVIFWSDICYCCGIDLPRRKEIMRKN